MHRLTIPAAVLCAVALYVPAAANANLSTHYQHRYAKVDRRDAGPYAGGVAGRNLADDGVLGAHGARPASRAELRGGLAVMHRMLNPAPAPQPTVAATPAGPGPITPAPAGGYTIPSYIVDCESGGSYTAQNPSGAYGAYQIMPATASAYGCDLSTPAGQDACAGRIYAAQGASAWACG